MKVIINFKYIVIIGVLSLASCSPDAEYVPIDERAGALPGDIISPADNILNAERVSLGRNLFWDPILSGDKMVSCATCHHPDKGWADGRDLAMGVGGNGLGENRVGGIVIKRNSPTIINTAYNGINGSNLYNPETAPMFWDNRVQSLESQAKGPVLSFEEMRGHAFSEEVAIDSIVTRLQNIPEYVQLFNNAYETEGINETTIFKAIAAFERTIVAGNSRFDQYAKGDDNALSAQELRGFDTFISNGCINCHNGPMFSDYKLHAIGVKDHPDLEESDTGDGQYRFRTPTLRNLTFTSPYMHNGTIRTIEDAVAFYEDTGEGHSQNPNVSSSMLSDDLSGVEVDDIDIALIVAFLKTLDDPNFDVSIPSSVPSNLSVGGNIN